MDHHFYLDQPVVQVEASRQTCGEAAVTYSDSSVLLQKHEVVENTMV